MQEGEDFIDDLAGVIEAQGLCEEFTAVEQLELFVKNAQCSKSLLGWLLSLEHEPTGHVNVLARYDMPLDTVCELMLEHRVMFKAPARNTASGGGGASGGAISRANPKPNFVSDQHRKPRMVVLPREFVRRRSRGCSALRRVWMDAFAVLTLVSVSTRRSP